MADNGANIVDVAMDAATDYASKRHDGGGFALEIPGMVFFLVVGVILFVIVRSRRCSILTPTHPHSAGAMPLFGAPPSITQRPEPGAAVDRATSICAIRAVSSKQDLFDRGLTLGFEVWLAVPGAAFAKRGMTWNESAMHATFSLPISPAMRKSLKCACKESPGDPTTSRVVTLRWAGGQLVLPLSGLIRLKKLPPARLTRGCLRLSMNKVIPGKWGSLVAVADVAALNSAAAAARAKPVRPAPAAQQPILTPNIDTPHKDFPASVTCVMEGPRCKNLSFELPKNASFNNLVAINDDEIRALCVGSLRRRRGGLRHRHVSPTFPTTLSPELELKPFGRPERSREDASQRQSTRHSSMATKPDDSATMQASPTSIFDMLPDVQRPPSIPSRSVTTPAMVLSNASARITELSKGHAPPPSRQVCCLMMVSSA